MTNTPHPPIGLGAQELNRRWEEHLKATSLDLRGLLIQAVAVHQGWEEGAIVLVDEAIMPVVHDNAKPDPSLNDAALEAAADKLGKTLRECEAFYPVKEHARETIEAYLAIAHPTPDRSGLVEKLNALTTHSFGRNLEPYYLVRQDVLDLVRQHEASVATLKSGGNSATADGESMGCGESGSAGVLTMLRRALALAAAPLEAMRLGGTLETAHSKDVRDAVAEALEAIRAALKGSQGDLQGREISVVDEKGLRQQIEVGIALGKAGKVDSAESVMRIIRPYLRTTEPVMVKEKVLSKEREAELASARDTITADILTYLKREQ